MINIIQISDGLKITFISSSAIIYENSAMPGNIVAKTAITFSAGASLAGRALACGTTVTMNTNSVAS